MPAIDVDAAGTVSSERDGSRLLREGGSLFTASVDSRSTARPGQRLQLTVNPSRFHFFDPGSGDALVATPALAGAR